MAFHLDFEIIKNEQKNVWKISQLSHSQTLKDHQTTYLYEYVNDALNWQFVQIFYHNARRRTAFRPYADDNGSLNDGHLLRENVINKEKCQ